jgi:predicted NBD/HSP70 family sugar kinase
MLRLRPESAHFAGIKLTGESLYAVVTDLHAEILASEERPLGDRSVEAVVALIVDVVGTLRAAFPRLSAIGVCLAGDVEVVDGRSVVVESHFLGWDAAPLELLIESATGLPVAVDNDVQALTTAHHWFGAGVGLRSLAVVGFGAGIGSGIVVNDELVRGARGHPGKVGHLFVTADGPGCDWGHPGCVSAYATIPALLRNAGTSSLAETIERAAARETRALDALSAAGRALGVVVATLADLVDPEKIVITGEGLPIARVARENLDRELDLRLDPASEPVVLELHDFAFTDYAWAAAISAVRHLV